MMVNKKAQYALRAVFELARRAQEGPVRIADIADSQAIPKRFLEVILGQMKQAGIVESRRGNEGGYVLKAKPGDLTVGKVLRLIQGSLAPVECSGVDRESRCPLHGDCVFLPMWERVSDAVSDIYDNTTFQDLLDEEARKSREYVPAYVI